MYHRRERTTTARRTEDGTTEDSHVDFLNLIVDIVNSLIQPGKQIMQNNKKKYTHKPGWAEYVDNLYDTSREI